MKKFYNLLGSIPITRRLIMQFHALTVKNILTLRRSPFTAFSLLITPMITVILASTIAMSIETASTRDYYDPYTDESSPLEIAPLKTLLTTTVLLIFAPLDSFSSLVMKQVAQNQGLNYEEHTTVQQLKWSSVYGFDKFETAIDTFLKGGFQANELQLMPFLIHFNHTDTKTYYRVYNYGEYLGININSLTNLRLWYSYGFDVPHKAEIMNAIDEAIINAEKQIKDGQVSTPIKLNYGIQPIDILPEASMLNNSGQAQPPSNAQSAFFDPTGMYVKIVLVFGQFPIAIYGYQQVVTEKHRGLLGHLRKIGMNEMVYWVANFFTLFIVLIVSNLLSLIGFGVAKSITIYHVFHRTPIEILFNVYLVYGIALVAFFLFMASLVKRPAISNTLVTIVSFSLSLSTLLLDLPLTEIPVWDVSSNIPATVFPWLGFSKCFTDISRITSNNGSYYNYHNYTHPYGPFKTSVTVIPPTYDYVESTSATLGRMVGFFVMFLVFAWYFNQALGSEGGYNYSLLFPLSPAYWGLAKPKQKIYAGDTLGKLQAESEKEGSMIIHKISKSYSSTTALKEFSHKFTPGKVYALLGHNGSGKTTLINLLTGVTNPTHGEAFFCGHSLSTEMREIQNMIGVCAQQDLLWDMLTGLEHIRLVALCRGIYMDTEEALKVLEQVRLIDAAPYKATMTYSGGMKRRLSLILSTIGTEDAQLLLLDEPMTGVDPIHKRQAWKVIRGLKKNRIVLLTTHNLEEADAMGDHIIILHGGHLKASGTSLYLKSKFGTGYQLTIVQNGNANEETSRELEKKVKKFVAGAETVSFSGGTCIFGIPKTSVKSLPALLRALELDESSLNVETRREWSVSNSTLEQVFLKLCAINTDVNAEVEGKVSMSEKEEVKIYCSICAKNLVQPVTLFTKAGIAVTVAGVLCKFCAEGETANTSNNDSIKSAATISTNYEVEFNTNQASPALLLQNMLEEEEELEVIPVSSKLNPSMLSQIIAIYAKNARLQSKLRKTNCCILLLLTICFIMLAIMNLMFGFNTYSYYSQENACPQGWMKSGNDVCNMTYIYGQFQLANSACSQDTPIDFNLNNVPPRNGLANDDLPKYGCLPNDFSYKFLGQNKYDQIKVCQGRFSGCTSLDMLPNDTVNQILFNDARTSVKFSQLLAFSSMNQSSKFKLVQTSADLSQVFKQSQLESSFAQEVGNTLCKEGDSYSFYNGFSMSYYYQDSYVPKRIFQSDSLANGLGLMYEKFSDAGITFNDLTSVSIDVTLHYLPQVAPFAQVVLPLPISCFKIQFAAVVDRNLNGFLLSLMQSLNNLMLRFTLNDPNAEIKSAFFILGGNSYSRGVYSQSLPGQLNQFSYGISPFGDFGKILQTFALLMILYICTMIFFPNFAQMLVTEKQENLLHMMRLQGLKLSAYWIANYLWYMTLGTIVSAFILFITYAASIKYLSDVSFFTLALLLILWTHSQVGVAILFSVVFKKPFVTLLMSFFFVLGIMIGIPITYLAEDFLTVNTPMINTLFPPIAFKEAIVRCVFARIDEEFYQIIFLSLWLFGYLLLFVGIYLHTVLNYTSSSSGTGGRGTTNDAITSDTKVDFFFFIPKSFKQMLFRNKFVISDSYSSESSLNTYPPEGIVDADLREERMNAINPKSADYYAVRLIGLQKVFNDGKSKKVAVNNLYLALKYGECFALLGPNGAGKTTTLNILTGAIMKSGGKVVVAGQELKTTSEMAAYIGICPQFDVVWADLSVCDHLTFYARLRGCPPLEIPSTIQRAAEEVGLDGDAFNLNAAQLSGGMRRRLSIAIALIGQCPIVLLDEPSTGLDVSNRAQVWKIIEKIRSRKQQCVILTTHAMEEADSLATRIGIMARGQLKCVGTQVYLKNRFGNGYRLSFRVQIYVRSPTRDQLAPEDQINAERGAMSGVCDYVKREISTNAQLNSAHQTKENLNIDTNLIESTRSGTQNYTLKTSAAEYIVQGWLITLDFNIPSNAKINLGDIFTKVDAEIDSEKQRDRVELLKKSSMYQLVEWSLNQASLEDVFVRVASDGL